MRRILIATLASLALGLPLLAAPAAHAQTEDTTTTTATPAHAHHARRHRRHHHRHHAVASAGRPDLTGSAGTGTTARDTTGAQTSLPSAVSNQAPGAH